MKNPQEKEGKVNCFLARRGAIESTAAGIVENNRLQVHEGSGHFGEQGKHIVILRE